MPLTKLSTHRAFLPHEDKVYDITIVDIIDEGKEFSLYPQIVYRYDGSDRWFYKIDTLPRVEIYVKEAEGR